MHPLNDALPGSYVPVRVTLGALVAHWYNIFYIYIFISMNSFIYVLNIII